MLNPVCVTCGINSYSGNVALKRFTQSIKAQISPNVVLKTCLLFLLFMLILAISMWFPLSRILASYELVS